MPCRALLLTLSLLTCVAFAGTESPTFHAISYHDVRDDVLADVDRDQYAISTRNLIDHFSWLKTNGFTVVNVDDVQRAERGEKPLPQNSVLLTFDDGLRSFYTHVFPLLKLFGYPAVAGIVTSWVETEARVEQAGRWLTRDDFLTWEQIREMQASGLVEIASHTHDLHQGILGNPHGNLQPAAVTRLYDEGQYEDERQYVERLNADLAASVRAIQLNTGRAPRILVWPFGAYTADALAVAAVNGLDITFTLDTASKRTNRLSVLKRQVFQGDPGIDDLGGTLLYPDAEPLIRVAQVDLDYVYDPDPAQQELNLSLLLDRIKALQISHVFLQAFSDANADGGAEALYFPNRHLPMRADLFNRAAWQLKTRANVLVYAWLPVLSFEGPGIDPRWRVMREHNGAVTIDDKSEPRLSPFSPPARSVIIDIYRDLAIHANFDGVLFHDDGRLSDTEDANPAAIAYYRAELGADFAIERAAADAALNTRWTTLKSRALIDLTDELARTVRRYRPAAKTVRNLFASSLLDPDGPTYLAQRFDEFLGAYDYVALMAMPHLEQAADPRFFYKRLINAVRAAPGGLRRTIFELQTVDWRTGRLIEGKQLQETMRWLQAEGVTHLGYYPDDFITGQPRLRELRNGISLAELPAEELR